MQASPDALGLSRRREEQTRARVAFHSPSTIVRCVTPEFSSHRLPVAPCLHSGATGYPRTRGALLSRGFQGNFNCSEPPSSSARGNSNSNLSQLLHKTFETETRTPHSRILWTPLLLPALCVLCPRRQVATDTGKERISVPIISKPAGNGFKIRRPPPPPGSGSDRFSRPILI